MATQWIFLIPFIFISHISHSFDIPSSCYVPSLNGTMATCCNILRTQCKSSTATVFNCTADTQNNLLHLQMRHCELNGNIPDTITALSYLQHFDLSLNSISGTIPQAIGDIGNAGSGLKCINLSNNSLSGSIPKSIGADALQSSLQYLDLSSNKLTRMNLPAIASLDVIEHLDLSNNRIAENFHESLGQFATLRILNLGNNRLSSSIPDSLGSMTQLQVLNLQKNEMSGTLPANLSRNTALQVLNISHNKFTGDVPSQWGTDWYGTPLEHLNLGNNLFDCPVRDYSKWATQSDFVKSYGKDGRAHCDEPSPGKGGLSGGVTAAIIIIILIALGIGLYCWWKVREATVQSHVKRMLHDEDYFDD
eukprot:272235_1